LEYLAAFFGCLYAGVIAVPAYPPRNRRGTPRILALVEDSHPAIALTTSQIQPNIASLLAEKTEIGNWQWLTTDTLELAGSESWQEPALHAEAIAFLQYTSGSTGTPKGVEVTHGNLLHNAAATYEYMGHSSASVFVSWLPTYHDMGLIGGILQPLYGGFPCILMPPALFLQRPYRWLQAIAKYRGTTSGAPNFAYDLCVEKITPEQCSTLDLSSWEVAFNGAEPVRYETLERFAAYFAPCGFRRTVFYPCYGMAEATLMVSGVQKATFPKVKTVQKSALERDRAVETSAEGQDAQTLVSCGYTLPEQEIAISNPQTLTPCRPGEIGEIWVSGPSVARGYWNRPEVTQETFQAHLADTGAGPFLRTGDLGFLDECGELFVTGRVKDLIIIRGRNLYPQDIELSTYRSHPDLRPHGSAAFSVEVAGEERLVVVQELEFRRKPDPQAVIAAIREAVAQDHEVQVYAVVIIKPGSIPKTSSGKIQRRACRAAFLANELQAWASDVSDREDWEPTATQQLTRETLLKAAPTSRPALLSAYLQQQVAQVLKLNPASISSQQSLAALGMDSLRAFELKNQIERDLEVAIADLFADMSIDYLSEQIRAQLSDPYPVPSLPQAAIRNAANEYPLSRAQKQLWFLTQLQPESPVYNLPVVLRWSGKLDLPRLTRSFNQVIERHEALRTSFPIRSGEPVQAIAPKLTLSIPVIDLQHLPLAEARRQAQQIASELAQQPFDLSELPLLRVQVMQVAQAEFMLIAIAHHIICDGQSIELLLSEFAAAYRSRSLVPVALQYLDFADRQARQLQTEKLSDQLAYWQQQLSQSPPTLALPTARSRPPVQSFRGECQYFRLPAGVTAALKALSCQEGVTLFMTLLAAFKTLLYRYTGQTDILVGSPIANRDRPALEGVFGLLINVLVLRTRLAGEISFRDLLARVRRVSLEAYQHRDFPFGKLVEELQPQRDPSRNPLFQVMFTLQDSPTAALSLPGITVKPVAVETKTAKFDLSLFLVDSGAEITGTWEYNRDLFDAETMERAIGHFQTLLAGIAADCDRKLCNLPLLPANEQQQLLVEWNNTDNRFAQYADFATIHGQFEAQVARTPDAIALTFQDQQLTYRELNARANKLAHYLRKLGVKREALVGISVERSLEMVVGLLGILKAGGAFVPVDPNYPPNRIALMLSDARISLLLTQQRWMEKFPQSQATVVCLDRDWEIIADRSRDSAIGSVTADNLAYVIYTSGSTGTPKGVQISHGSVVNFLNSMREKLGINSDDIFLAVTTISFDIAGLELYLPLTTGASVVLASRDTVIDSNQLSALLARSPATIMQATPATWTLLLSAGWTGNPQLKLLCGGESLSWQLANQLLTKGRELWNLYGPTETTIWSTVYPVQGASEGTGVVPIGCPIANTKIYVLDESQQPVPVGIPGEIYIGGSGLARGYLNRQQLTQEKFIPNPFSNDPNSRLYRTGDLARYFPNGNLEYLGRIDNQVKVRGYRIELGEIEAVLNAHPKIQQAVAIAREDQLGQTSIFAYLTCSQPEHSEASLLSKLRNCLQAELPTYMMPAAFVFLDAFPLMPNGKIDRRSLPKPEQNRQSLTVPYTAPQTAIEQAIAQVWQEVLHANEVGTNDNFFDLGGHSLLLVQVKARLQEILERDISVVELFQHPTISSLARYLSDREGRDIASDAIDRRVLQQKAALNRQKQLRQQGRRIHE